MPEACHFGREEREVNVMKKTSITVNGKEYEIESAGRKAKRERNNLHRAYAEAMSKAFNRKREECDDHAV